MKLAEIEWTDEAREVILPSAVPITIVREGVRERQGPRAPDRAEPSVKMEEPDVISTDAEGGLESNAEEIRVVAGSARTEMGSENRLDRPEQPAPATADGAPEGSSQGGSAPSVPKRGERPAKD